MSRNSLEKRSNMLQKAWLNRSRLNPESSTSIVIDPVHCISKIKSQEDLVLIKNMRGDTETLESRYHALQNMYQELMTKAKGQKSIVEKQNQEMEKLRIVHMSNQNEIMRLRGKLGFLHKDEKHTEKFTSHKKETSLFNESSNVRSSLHIQKYSNYSIKEYNNDEQSFKNIISPKIAESSSHARISTPVNSKNTTMKSTNASKSGSSWISSCAKETVFDMKDTVDENFEELRANNCGITSDFKNKYKFVSSLALA